MNKTITSLYNYYKNTPKKLKIVCDWDEVIQACEPYALWLTPLSEKQKKEGYVDEGINFSEYFKVFWEKWSEPWIEYSLYSSRLIPNEDKEKIEQQQNIKNSPDFYQKAPFLTITKDLLKLIKEGKVSRLIFLSAYDKRKFPYGDGRKEWIFKETFDKVGYEREDDSSKTILPCYLELIGFDSETQGQSKADWIKKNASDFDLVIDDNPYICKILIENNNSLICGSSAARGDFAHVINSHMKVIAPHYPAIADQHHEEVLLVKTSVSDLGKEDFTEKEINNEEINNKSNPCQKCGSSKTGKEKVYQNIWRGNEFKEIHTGNLIYCEKCVNNHMEEFDYWEKLADELKVDCIRYWQLSYIRYSDEELGFCLHASGEGDDWLSGELNKEENQQLLTIIQKNDKVAFRKFITKKLTELAEREKEIRTNRSEADKKERKLKNILDTLETIKIEVEELIEEIVPIWKEARRKYETE
ncbi:hypothetical protein [endosymbiont GvMRE of Glomus versiforme]|uniref:hypothetical protein n=1 Tax=endosymbiont GvMRE of Glomus versiforme TaxID=2039283 RepID=UPI000EC8D185|nr:hypothetical protein [endosymbiont GvMRE of Glomus versiforme]RHZ37506.1 hypothetical protein GvMRE_I1g415 [endosymbiont GvMRE of Glomus versiforme]